MTKEFVSIPHFRGKCPAELQQCATAFMEFGASHIFVPPSENELDDLMCSLDAHAPQWEAAAPAKPSDRRRTRFAPAAANTNVVSVQLGSLEKVAQVLTGDPMFCSSCKAIYNAESHRALEEKQQKAQVCRPVFCFFV